LVLSFLLIFGLVSQRRVGVIDREFAPDDFLFATLTPNLLAISPRSLASKLGSAEIPCHQAILQVKVQFRRFGKPMGLSFPTFFAERGR
jgi:hypothetical protein